MIHRQLGKTGPEIPPVIFGTSALGNLYTALREETKREIIAECIRHVPKPVVFDSAGKYGAGLALEKLGEILGMLSTGQDDVIISNKLGWLRTPLLTQEPAFEKGVWKDINNDARQEIGYNGILECWEQGNELLGGRYRPQLVSIHDPDEYLGSAVDDSHRRKLIHNITEAYRALAELKKQGEVKAVGVGSKDWRTIELIAGEVDLDWVMFANSMTILRHPGELLAFMETLHRKGVGIINSAVFNAGFLTGGDFFDYVRIKPDTEENRSLFRWRENFFTICKRHGILPANACVRFALTPPGVVSVSLNTSDPARVKQNVESVTCHIPGEFWSEMVKEGLIDKDYPYL